MWRIIGETVVGGKWGHCNINILNNDVGGLYNIFIKKYLAAA